MIYVFLFHYLPRPFFYRKSWALFNYKGLAGSQLLLKIGNKNTRSAGNTPGAVQRYIIPDTTYRLHLLYYHGMAGNKRKLTRNVVILCTKKNLPRI